MDDLREAQAFQARRTNVSIEEFSDFRNEVRDDVKELHLSIEAWGKNR